MKHSLFFTLVLVAAVISTSTAAAIITPPIETMSYQGQLDSSGAPYSGPAKFKFAFLCQGNTVWSNDGTSHGGSEPTDSVTLTVAQGLFNLMLGDANLGMVPLSADLVDGCGDPVLRVWVSIGNGFEQLTDQPLGAVPFALRATNADGAIGTFTVTNGNLVIKYGTSTTIQLTASTGQASVSSIRFGDGTVQSTAATTGGGGPTTHYLSISPDAFKPTDSTMNYHRSSLLVYGTTAGQGMTWEAPVYLPDGATITGFDIYETDSDGTLATGANIQNFLLRDPLLAGTGSIIGNLNSASGSGAPGFVHVSQTGLSSVVDNSLYSYTVSANWKVPVSPLATSALQINGMRITYTMP